jgi:predicted RNA methylase
MVPHERHWFDARLDSDEIFDRVYEPRIRELSEQHWTPVRVAARAATLLTQAGATRILDVGSGVGKFCITGALCTDAEFVGVDRREDLFRIACATAAELGAMRARFVHSAVDEFSFDGFDGVYLYNPFFEQISASLQMIDETVERSVTTYDHFVRVTVAKLRAMRPPVAVATYHGFGGRLDDDFTFVGDEPAGNEVLELWVKR